MYITQLNQQRDGVLYFLKGVFLRLFRITCAFAMQLETNTKHKHTQREFDYNNRPASVWPPEKIYYAHCCCCYCNNNVSVYIWSVNRNVRALEDLYRKICAIWVQSSKRRRRLTPIAYLNDPINLQSGNSRLTSI